MRLADIGAAVAREGRAVLVLVAEARGSAPREAGAAMLITGGGTLGTVGGGAVEHRAVEIARNMLSGAAEPRAEVEFPLGPALDQCCGGRMRLAFVLLTSHDLQRLQCSREGSDGRPLPQQGEGREGRRPRNGWGAADRDTPRDIGDALHLPRQDGGRRGGRPRDGWWSSVLVLWPGGPEFREPAPDRQAIVYGAGHVGRALVGALAPLPIRLVWADARAGACAGAPTGVEAHETPLPEAVAEAAEPDAMHVVLTHSHALDLEIVTAIMSRDFGFCGLIGSATKRALFRRKLAERGIARGAIDRLTCPIGLPGLRDKRPAVIAASVAAQLVQVDAALAARRPTVRAG
jgi:xanthine dehydrogenase accessory factor